MDCLPRLRREAGVRYKIRLLFLAEKLVFYSSKDCLLTIYYVSGSVLNSVDSVNKTDRIAPFQRL